MPRSDKRAIGIGQHPERCRLSWDVTRRLPQRIFSAYIHLRVAGNSRISEFTRKIWRKFVQIWQQKPLFQIDSNIIIFAEF